MLDGSNHTDSCKGVPFGGFIDTAPHFVGEILLKLPILGTWIGLFKPNGQNMECFILSKLRHPFQPYFARR